MEVYYFDNQIEQYPIVLIPNKIKSNLDNGIDFERIIKYKGLIRPSKLSSNPPKYPQKTIIINSEQLSIYLNEKIVFVVMPLIMAVLVASGNSVGFIDFLNHLLFFLGFQLVLNIVFFNIRFKKINTKKYIEVGNEEFGKLLAIYQIDYEKYKKEQITIDEKFDFDIKAFEEKVNQDRYMSEDEIHFKDIEAIEKAYRTTVSAKKGKAEVIFLEWLNKEFYGSIFYDMYFKNNNKIFYPDFTFVCRITGLHIDIEIDEPYNLYNKKPIHYKSEDKFRNDFFINNNWCIIRFSEKQVMENPKECCKTIRSIYESIFRIDNSYYCWVNRENAWSYEDAILLAKNKYRESYD